MFHFNVLTVVNYQLSVSVLCFRNPKDTAVSLYNHHRDLVEFYNYNGEWKDWLPLFMQGKDVASDVGVNLCNVNSCLNTSSNEIFTDKRGDLPCVNISKHTCPVVK